MKTPERIYSIAVVDDDADQRGLLRGALEQNGCSVLEASNGEEAVALASSATLDAMILDVRMPKMSGLEALKIIKGENPSLPIILLTAFIDVRDAVDAMKSGAHDYLEKPVDLDELAVCVDEAIGITSVETSLSKADDPPIPDWIIADSPIARSVLRDACRAANTSVNILLEGESGTGKEVLAKYIHAQSVRRNGPLVAVNCAALPENLIESALFGHEKGAFTGAVSTRQGFFEEASSGVLFLDEVGEMPLSLQPKLLRTLEDKTIRRVGGERIIPVDARVVAATNRNLQKEVSEGRFREDLYYRLNVFSIRLPRLSERKEDILPLVDKVLRDEGMADKRLSPACARLLLAHAWPGNVRELRNAVIRAAILSNGSLILPEDLPEAIRANQTVMASDSVPLPIEGGTMEDLQKAAILKALDETRGNKTRAAEILQISRRSLIYKLRSYGM